MSKAVLRTVSKLFGLLAVIAGVILLPLPLPLGIPLVAIGVMILLSTSITARRIVRALRVRSDKVDRLFTMIENKLAGRAGTLLRSTRRMRPGRHGQAPKAPAE